jgi:hypothetical protein
MSITDELRKEARGFGRYVYTAPQADCLTAIANRIDAALEGYIELPKDADGVTIRIGDMMEGYCKTIKIVELRNSGTWHLVDEFGNEWHDHEAFVHVQPDSWERIIRDAQGDGILNQIDGRPSDFDALVERCKRLAELVGSTKKNVGEEA